MKTFIINLTLLFFFMGGLMAQNSTPSCNIENKNIQRFMARRLIGNMDSVKLIPEIIRRKDDSLRVLISFIISKEGNVDSILVHENTFDGFKNAIIRVLKRSNGHWTPAMKDGVAVNSSRIYWPFFVYCESCSKDADKFVKANRLYFENYRYDELPGWTKDSEVYAPNSIGVSEPVR